MGQPANSHQVNYIEFSASDIQRAKDFYAIVFGWTFQDWGPDYVSFKKADAGIDGGFRRAEPGQSSGITAPLIVLYSADLKATESAIVAAGGRIVVPTFEFPGGRRFHFLDSVGNTLAIWSE